MFQKQNLSSKPIPVNGPAMTAPKGIMAPIQEPSSGLTPVMSQSSGKHWSVWMWGRAGAVHAKAVPQPKEPRVAGKCICQLKQTFVTPYNDDMHTCYSSDDLPGFVSLAVVSHDVQDSDRS